MIFYLILFYFNQNLFTAWNLTTIFCLIYTNLRGVEPQSFLIYIVSFAHLESFLVHLGSFGVHFGSFDVLIASFQLEQCKITHFKYPSLPTPFHPTRVARFQSL